MDTLTLTMVDGSTVTFDYPPRSHLPRYLRGKGIQNYEPISTAAFLHACDRMPGGVFDIGANIGLYSMAAATGIGRSVTAFEPFAPPAAVLRAIVADRGFPIEVVEAAMGAEPGEAQFHISAKSDMSNSLNSEFRQALRVETVRVTTIDEAAASHGAPTVIKMDTETTELDVIRGGERTIQETRPFILMESLSAGDAEAVDAIFGPLDYEIVRLGEPEVQARIEGLDGLMVDGDLRNWLLVPPALKDGLFEGISAQVARLRDLPVAE